MNTAIFDIETTALGGVGAGILLAVCVRPCSTQRTRTLRIDQYEYEKDDNFGFLEREEADLLRETLQELCKYDLLVGHNVERFDVKYLRTRAVQHGIACNFTPFVYDTFKAFRRTGLLTVPNGFGKPSAGLDMVADFFKVKQEKTKVYPVEWWMAVWGKKLERIEALNEITRHCQADVRMLAGFYPALLEQDRKAIIRRLM